MRAAGPGVFGTTTALNDAASGLVDWLVALLFITGGIGGGWIGAHVAQRLSAQRQTLRRLLRWLVLVSGYIGIVGKRLTYRTTDHEAHEARTV